MARNRGGNNSRRFFACIGWLLLIVPGIGRGEGPTLAAADSARLRQYEQAALTTPGDAAAGKALFLNVQRTKCGVCHKVAGQGGEVGPDLSFIGGKFDRPHLIESLLEPSKQIVEGYRSSVVVTTDGRVRTGLVKEPTPEKFVLVDANNQRETIAVADVDRRVESDVSIMPQGLAEALSMQEFAYLESLRDGGKEKFGAGIRGPIRVPEGFEVVTVATGLSGATALEILPDGRILICEQAGAVRVVENDHLVEDPFVTLPVDADWERGVIGVTCDPDFPRSPYIYICWVAKEPYPHHVVSRFTADLNLALEDSELILLAGDDQRTLGGKKQAGHQGGALHFGPDGALYIAIGEQTAETPAQAFDTLQGKILRLNADGSIPSDNPFVSRTQGKYRAIWALGCRNPYTFAFERATGRMLINDVGGKFEEINVGRAGTNYGWPTIDHGPHPDDQFAGPIHWYPQASISGGDFLPANSKWPAQYRGRYFFADFVHGWIHTLDPSAPPSANAEKFASGLHRPVDLRFAPDGGLYVLIRNAWVIDDKFQQNTSSLLKIRQVDAERRSKADGSGGKS